MSDHDLLFTPRLRSLADLVRATLSGAGLAHDWDHIHRVSFWAYQIAVSEDESPELSVATGLVHDLVAIPKESIDRPLGGQESAIACRPLLEESGYSPEEVALIVDAVATSSWSRGLAPNSALGAILQDADRLDAIGAVGIARNFACAQEMASRASRGRFYDPTDPLGEGARELDDRLNAMDHWKLKLLRLAGNMHTEAARNEARRREEFMHRFMQELALELPASDTEHVP
jgi:uncharacterized protein